MRGAGGGGRGVEEGSCRGGFETRPYELATGVVHDDARAVGGGACPLSLWERVRVRETGSSGGVDSLPAQNDKRGRVLRGVGGGGRGVEEGSCRGGFETRPYELATGVVHDDARAAGGGACPLSLWERVRVRETGGGGWSL